MEKEFIAYEQVLELKDLGFDEPCFGLYENGKLGYSFSTSQGIITPISYRTNSKFVEHILTKEDCTAPTFSQAFRWFRENRGLCIVIKPIDDKKLGLGYNLLKNGWIMSAHLSYEKAELGCLKGLIKLVKEK